MADRIRWEQSTAFESFMGYAGTHKPWAFEIYPSTDPGWWTLISQLPRVTERFTNTDPEQLKAQAERLLVEFAGRFGAVFPDKDDVAAEFTTDGVIFSMRSESGAVFCCGINLPYDVMGTQGPQPAHPGDWINRMLHDYQFDEGRKVRLTLEILEPDAGEGSDEPNVGSVRG